MTKKVYLTTISLSLLVILIGCPPPHQTSGNISMALKDYEQAVVQYQQGLESDPDSVTLLTGLGRAHYNLGQYDEAIEAFQHSLDIEEYPLASFYLGLTYIAKGEREKGFRILHAFRYTGKRYLTKSIRDMAYYLEPQTSATSEEITTKMFRAWNDGLAMEEDAARPGN